MENPFETLLAKLNNIERIVQQISANQQIKTDSTKPENEILNVAQTAELIGVTIPTVYGYTHDRKIPHYKKGKRLYFNKNEIVKWLLDNRIKTMAEIDQEANNYIIRRETKIGR